jgi:hypothetical protein
VPKIAAMQEKPTVIVLVTDAAGMSIALYTSQKLFKNQSITSDKKLNNGTVADYENPYESTT